LGCHTADRPARARRSTKTRRLEFIGLRIVATSDGYDSTSTARKVHRGFKGLMNEIFLDDLRERVCIVDRLRAENTMGAAADLTAAA
jgi:hypothetical protein